MEAGRVLRIPRNPVRKEYRWIIPIVRARHAQGFEDVRIRECSKRLSTHNVDDPAEQVVCPIVVLIFVAGLEVHTTLTREHWRNRLIRTDVARSCPPEQGEPVTQATGVREEMADCDVVFAVEPVGNVPAYVIIERELAAFAKQQNTHGRELLRDRGGAKDRRGRDAHTKFQIRHPIAVFVHDSAVSADGDTATWRI